MSDDKLHFGECWKKEGKRKRREKKKKTKWEGTVWVGITWDHLPLFLSFSLTLSFSLSFSLPPHSFTTHFLRMNFFPWFENVKSEEEETEKNEGKRRGKKKRRWKRKRERESRDEKKSNFYSKLCEAAKRIARK